MSDTTVKDRRSRRRVNLQQPLEIRLRVDEPGRAARLLVATVVDQSEGGLGLSGPEELAEGLVVGLEPSRELAASAGALPPRAKVMWCSQARSGHYRIGLRLMPDSAPPPPGAPAVEEAQADHYETLQIHPKAHPDTIHRVYRLLAQRYHPDNRETGDENLFRAIALAYKVLGDPDLRVSYDLGYEALHRKRLRLVEGDGGNGDGSAGERRKRQALLASLYRRRLQDPVTPTLSIFDLEEYLGVPREHLEFSLWYTRERGFISRSDNNRYQITVAGVDECERLEEQSAPSARLLPAAG